MSEATGRSGGVTLLGPAEVQGELARTPGWTLSGHAIERTYRLADFKAAMIFVNGVAAIAEGARHHPDVAIHSSAVTLSLWTHAAGGLTTRDFALAREIDAALPSPSLPPDDVGTR